MARAPDLITHLRILVPRGHPDNNSPIGVLPAWIGMEALEARLLLATHYVDCELGDDSQSALKAQDPDTPWQTIQHAVKTVSSGDTVEVVPGICSIAGLDEIEIDTPNITLTTTGAVIETAPNQIGIRVRADGVVVDGFEIRTDKEGIIVAMDKSGDVISNVILRNLHIESMTHGGSLSLNGIRVNVGSGVIVENSIVKNTDQQGILFKDSTNAFVNNNLVIGGGEWGIHLDNGSETGTSIDNIVAFNTVVRSGYQLAGGGGIRFQTATGEIRDNLVVNNASRGIKTNLASVFVHHNNVFGNPIGYEFDADQESVGWSNLAIDPLFIDPDSNDYRLQHVDAGQDISSPVIDAGSIESGSFSGSTRTDGVPDSGTADLGFHEGSGSSTSIPSIHTPTPEELRQIYYVDAVLGDDFRHSFEASNPEAPWATIRRALSVAISGDAVFVASGTYPEAVASSDAGITFKAIGENTLIAPPAGETGIRVDHAGWVVEGFEIQGGVHGIRAQDADDLIIRGLKLHDQTSNGLTIRDSDRVLIESNKIDDVSGRGIHASEGSDEVVVQNNLITDSGEWGIHIEGDELSDSSDNRVAFNTVYNNGHLLQDGGIRFQTATGEIRDNLVVNNASRGIKTNLASVFVHHNNVFGNPIGYEFDADQESVRWSNIDVDPMFVNPGSGDFSLSQEASGQMSDSPVVNAGSDVVMRLGVSGSTRTDLINDVGLADLGFHDQAIEATSYWFSGAFVDCDAGNDSNTHWQGRFPETPFRTIERALESVDSGSRIVVLGGTCEGDLRIDVPNVTVVTSVDDMGANIVAQPGDTAVRIEADGVVLDGFVIQSDTAGVLVDMPDIDATLSDVVLRNLRVEPLVSGELISSHAVEVVDGFNIVIENSIIQNSSQRGILIKGGSGAYVRNNLITGHRQVGIHIDGGFGFTSEDNIVAFNTIANNGSLSFTGGVLLQNATGEIRDNIIANNTSIGIRADTVGAVLVHHNDVFGNSTPYVLADVTGWANLASDPLFIDESGSDYRLSSSSSGQIANSPAIDSGSVSVGSEEISGSTTTDGLMDTGTADLGFHLSAFGTSSIPPIHQPTPIDLQATYYVDIVNGDDSRHPFEATDPRAPWATIDKALSTVSLGDTVVVASGTYGAIQIATADLLFKTDSGATIEAAADQAGVVVSADGVVVEGFTVRSDTEGVVVESTSTLSGVVLRDLQIEPLVGGSIATNGVRVSDSQGVVVENSTVDQALLNGIVYLDVVGGYVRNNRISRSGQWGIRIEGQTSLSDENIVAFNTVVGNGTVPGEGGIQFLNATGEIRDNIVASNVDVGIQSYTNPVFIHHNAVFNNPTSYSVAGAMLWANLITDPVFVNSGEGDYRLSAVAAGQLVDSPLFDVASVIAGDPQITGSARTDGVMDLGRADIGFHEGADPSSVTPYIQMPPPWLVDNPETQDIDQLYATLGNPAPQIWADLDSDNDVDHEDVRMLVEEVISTAFGDADLDKKVDITDFALLAGGMGTLGGWEEGNFDGLGVVDLLDFALLAGSFGRDSTMLQLGDVDVDGDIETDDLNALITATMDPTPRPTADLDGDFDADQDDIQILEDLLGISGMPESSGGGGSESTSLPDPVSGAMPAQVVASEPATESQMVLTTGDHIQSMRLAQWQRSANNSGTDENKVFTRHPILGILDDDASS